MFPKALEIANQHNVSVIKIDINEVKQVAGQNLVFTVPTILLIKEGKEILRESRFIDFQNLERVLGIVMED